MKPRTDLRTRRTMPHGMWRRKPPLPAKPKGLAARAGAAVDALVGIFSPEAQGRRAAARAALELSASAWNGARGGRTWDSRTTITGGSADADLDEEALEKLRERSRHLDRNDPAARSMLSAMADNIVGAGFVPRLNLPWRQLGITRERARELAEQAAIAYQCWEAHADSTNQQTFSQMQHLAIASALVNGDVFALPLQVEDARVPCPYRLKVELVEADRVDTPWGVDGDRDIRSGVELGARGQPIGYWIHVGHPGDFGYGRPERRMRRYPAHTPSGRPAVLHVFDRDRVGQTRGRPVLAAALDYFQHAADYVESELVAANVAACFAAFVKRETTDQPPSFEQDEEGNFVEQLNPGEINYLNPGEDIVTANPGRPNQQFGPFLDRILRGIASSLGMSYPIATRDFAGTTYSQARADLLEAWRSFQRRQRWFVSSFCQPIWKLLLEEAWLTGRFDAPASFREEIDLWTRAVWVPPGRGWIDPSKEVAAWSQALEIGVTTRSEIIAGLNGGDVESITEQLAHEQQLREELLGAAEPAASGDEADDDAEAAGEGEDEDETEDADDDDGDEDTDDEEGP